MNQCIVPPSYYYFRSKFLKMKQIFLLISILTIGSNLYGQIYGNGTLVSKNVKIQGLTDIDIELNANVILDYSANESISIVSDENVIEFIQINIENGRMRIDQKMWIEPSSLPIIKIGCPSLRYIYQGTHSSTFVKNVNIPDLKLAGNVGEITLEGVVDNLYIEIDGTDLNLENLVVGEMYIAEHSEGNVVVNKNGQLSKVDLSNTNLNWVDNSQKDNNASITKKPKVDRERKVKYIEFEIRNNSLKRSHFYVKGPNGRGGTFSYGFSMLPQTKRDENWSIGTKVYQEGKNGKLTKLLTIKADDEGKILDLY